MKKYVCFLTVLAVILTLSGCKNSYDLQSDGLSSMINYSVGGTISDANNSNSNEVSSIIDEEVSSNTYSSVSAPKAETPKSCEHDYRKEIVGVSCDSDGYLKYTCTKCGNSYKGEGISAGHDFSKYLCERCGKVDPTCDIFWGVNAFLSKYGTPNGKGNINCYPNENADLRVCNYLDQNNFFIEYQDDTAGEIFTLWVKPDISTVSFRKGSTYGEYEIKNSALSSAEKIVFDDFSTNPENPVDKDVFATECAPKIDEYLRMAESRILIPKMGLKLSDFGLARYN